MEKEQARKGFRDLFENRGEREVAVAEEILDALEYDDEALPPSLYKGLELKVGESRTYADGAQRARELVFFGKGVSIVPPPARPMER